MSPIFAKLTGAGLLALAALSGCTVVVDEGGPPPYQPGPPPIVGPGPQICPQIYAPVCGERGGRIETLSNECVARSRGFRVIADGECRVRPPITPRPPIGGPGPFPPGPGGPQFCTREYAPVCARRGGQVRQFPNACEAEVDGFRIIRDGPC